MGGVFGARNKGETGADPRDPRDPPNTDTGTTALSYDTSGFSPPWAAAPKFKFPAQRMWYHVLNNDDDNIRVLSVDASAESYLQEITNRRSSTIFQCGQLTVYCSS